MDQSEFDIGSADLPQRGQRSQALVRVIDGALPEPLVRRARAAIARIGTERLRQSYFTTFWLARGRSGPRTRGRGGDGAVAPGAAARLRRSGMVDRPRAHHPHPRGVPFRPGRERATRCATRASPASSSSTPSAAASLRSPIRCPDEREAKRLETVAPKRNRYAMFAREPAPRRPRRARPHAGPSAAGSTGADADHAGGELLGAPADRRARLDAGAPCTGSLREKPHSPKSR